MGQFFQVNAQVRGDDRHQGACLVALGQQGFIDHVIRAVDFCANVARIQIILFPAVGEDLVINFCLGQEAHGIGFFGCVLGPV